MYIFSIKPVKQVKKLQNCIQLAMLFLFVEPLFRYLFLPLLAHDNQTLESLFGSPIAGAHEGLTPQMNVMPVVQKNHSLTRRVIFELLLKRVLSNFLETGLQRYRGSDYVQMKNHDQLAVFPVQLYQSHDA